jgi:hypothetical protein
MLLHTELPLAQAFTTDFQDSTDERMLIREFRQ